MLRQEFEVTLKDNVIISQSSATIGQHQSLGYIPGSVFLGVAAARLYGDFEKDQMAWNVFHSGNVRFGNATLTAGSERTMPVPMAFHIRKGAIWKETINGLSYLKQSEVLSFLDAPDDIREKLNNYQPIRDGYICESGAILSPEMHFEMKTAVNENTNVAAENQLFGYQSLKAGQKFRFVLESDNDDQATFNRIAAVFNGQIRIGRSRSAQFGRAYCTPVQQSGQASVNEGDVNKVSLLCCSDLALVNASGAAAYFPDAADLGLPEDWQLELANSFIRTRQYSPYNGKRRAYDLERQVISKGSVLTFSGTTASTIVSEFYAGLYQEQGLGALRVMPAWMTQPEVNPEQPDSKPEAQNQVEKDIPAPDTSLIRWLNCQKNKPVADKKWVEALLERYQQLLINARRLNGIATSIDIGPSKSQWGVLYQLLINNRHESANNIQELLFNKTSGVCKPARSDEYAWAVDVMDKDNDTPVTLSSWFESQIRRFAKTVNDQQLLLTLILLADGLKRDPQQSCHQDFKEEDHA